MATKSFDVAMQAPVVAPQPAPRKIYSQMQMTKSSTNLRTATMSNKVSFDPSHRFKSKFLDPLNNEFKLLMGNFQNNHHQNYPLKSIGKIDPLIAKQQQQQTPVMPSSRILQQQASEESNERTSDEDTEDSSDQNKQEKPKPGKLDLSQFNNLSHAIGKLSVQPPTSSSSSATTTTTSPSLSKDTHSKSFTPQQQQSESGFFKSRAKKSSKSKLPTTPATPTTTKTITSISSPRIESQTSQYQQQQQGKFYSVIQFEQD